MSKNISFELIATDPSGARRGRLRTSHGSVDTPAFMVVGTEGFFRSAMPKDIEETGTQIALANTYHLSTEERLATVKRSGGIHQVMAWNGPVLTDSGGFQVFSLPDKKITEEGVTFSFKEKEKPIFLSPERSMEIQRTLGADIVMAFDECIEYPAAAEYVYKSVERTTRWARRCRNTPLAGHQFLFGIVQGGVYPELRTKSAREITAIPFDGFAIGGVSVGEGHDLMKAVVDHTAPLLPSDKPKYLMGVGMPEDLIEAVRGGMDMFDCVIPTRFARLGTLFTRMGKIRIMDKTFRKDKFPLDTQCTCYTCRNYSRMVLRYLFFMKDPLAWTLATIHNVTFYQDLMQGIRTAIEQHVFEEFAAEFLGRYQKSDRPTKSGRRKK